MCPTHVAMCVLHHMGDTHGVHTQAPTVLFVGAQLPSPQQQCPPAAARRVQDEQAGQQRCRRGRRPRVRLQSCRPARRRLLWRGALCVQAQHRAGVRVHRLSEPRRQRWRRSHTGGVVPPPHLCAALPRPALRASAVRASAVLHWIHAGRLTQIPRPQLPASSTEDQHCCWAGLLAGELVLSTSTHLECRRAS